MARTQLLLATLGFSLVASAQELQRGEYFVGADPGFGNGTPIAFTPTSEIDLQLTVDVSNLTPGNQVLGIRLLDTEGNWGLTNRKLFRVRSMATGGDVIRFEHFLDVDPGFGNGTVAIASASPDINDFIFDEQTDALSSGPHALFVRAMSSPGAWSLTNALQFNVAVGVEELSGLGITVGPNPMQEELSLHRSFSGQTIHLDLRDAQGKLLRREQWTNDRLDISTAELPVGNYFMLLRIDHREPLVLKLVKD